MNARELQQLRTRMGEVAALPPDHPDREAVAGWAKAAGGEIEQEWLATLRWDEQVRAELPRVSVPPALEEDLLKIPARHGRSRFSRFPRLALTSRSRWRLAAAGAVAALVLLGVGITLQYRARQARAMSDFASMVARSHDGKPPLEVASGDFQTVQDQLQKHLPFTIMRPDVDPKFHLLGGAVVRLDGQTVMYTRWESQGRHYSLYQFCAKDFGIHEGLKKTSVTPGGRPGCQVLFWSQGTCDYALVNDDAGETRPANRTAFQPTAPHGDATKGAGPVPLRATWEVRESTSLSRYSGRGLG